MKHYIGLDVSLKETHICIVDYDGQIVWQGECVTSPAAISEALTPYHDTIEVVVLETGGQSSWLQKGLSDLDLPTVIVDARRAKGALSCRLNKTDANDAEGLAQLARTGWYHGVMAKREETRFIRSQLLARHLLIKQRRDIENQIRAILRGFGLQVGSVARNKFEARIHELVDEQPELNSALTALLTARHSIMKQIDRLDGTLNDLYSQSKLCQRFMSVPGVGPLTALTFITAIDDPTRFEKSSSVGAYLGLTPRRYQSGEVDRSGRISKHGDALARHMLYEAASALISRVKRWSSLKAWAMKIVKRSGQRKARVALARKLSLILHRIWMDGTEFCWSKKEVGA